MKTFVLTFAKQFMKGHPKQGQPTDFEKKLQCQSKIHTIRSNFDYWAPKIAEAQAGEAILSLRTWKGKPYRSNQKEFMRVGHHYSPGYQRITFDDIVVPKIDGQVQMTGKLAENDGLSYEDFNAWFSDKFPFKGILIHFTDFRY